MIEVTAPASTANLPSPIVFLAGSIEMGDAPKWRRAVVEELAPVPGSVLNPRRSGEFDSADSSVLRAQIQWELEALDRADLIAMYFAPVTRSPVTLLEFGLYARSRKIVVCCPEAYWRYHNVAAVCVRYAVPLVSSLKELVQHVHDFAKAGH